MHIHSCIYMSNASSPSFIHGAWHSWKTRASGMPVSKSQLKQPPETAAPNSRPLTQPSEHAQNGSVPQAESQTYL